MNQSIDYPSKCKLALGTANTLEHLLGMIQGLRSTSLSNRLPSYLKAGDSQTVLTRMVHQSAIDRSIVIVHILQLLVQLIVPLINYWQQTLCRGLILFT
jgi:hypothetical protein